MYRPKLLKIKNILSWKEVEFQFHQGKAVIIIGENKDDPGQKGNGSGKSGLTEGAVIAITGSCIRPIKNKEIVRRGCDEGEVEIVLENAMLNTELRIWRKLYSGSKSAEYRMWENDEECKEMYSDANMFNAFVWTMLGISKEDFFSFYVLEKTETPFLLMGDVEKKKVVNRFSGANKVDAAIPYVEADVLVKDKEVKRIDGLILSVKGKQELLSEQIQTEEEKYSEEGKKLQFVQIDEKISTCKLNLNGLEDHSINLEVQLRDKKAELNKFKATDFAKEIDKLNNALTKEIDKGKAIEDSIKEIQGRRDQAIEIQSELKNSLAGLIECPKCQHEFKLEEEEGFDAQINRVELVELETIIMPEVQEELGLERNKKAAQNEAITKAQSAVRELRNKEEKEVQDKRVITKAIEKLEEDISKNDKAINNKRTEIENLEKERAVIDNGQSDKLEQLNEQLLTYIDQETELREQLEAAEGARIAVEKWLTHFKSFKSHLANKSIANIQDYANMYLQSLGSNIQIIIEGYKVLSNKKLKEEITTLVRRNGIDDASYGSYSGGEKGRIDICCILAIQTLINLNSSTGGIDLLILDEVMDSVDSLGLENIIGALQNIDRTIMIVSQNEINALSKQTITICKQNRISTIV